MPKPSSNAGHGTKSDKAQKTHHVVALSAISGNRYVRRKLEARGGFCVYEKTMFDFLQTIFTKITSAVASIIIAVGLVSAPVPQQEPPPQVEVKQDVQELEKANLKAELEQKVEAAKAKAEAERARKEAEAARRKIAEDDLRKQQKEQARQLEQQRIQQELAQQNLLSCNGKNWSPCPAGQKFYCPATGDAQCLIENTQTSSATSRLKYCLQLAAEPENYKDPCDDPTYDATQKAFCGLVTGGLRTSPSTKLSDCLGTYHPPSYSPPPAYSPPSSYTPHDYSPSADDMIKKSDEWWENYRQEQLNKTVCEGIGKNYYGSLGCR